jgi:hypothetical protein
MGAKKDNGNVELELIKLKEKIGLLEDLCEDDLSEEAVRAAARDLRQRVDKIAKLVLAE